MFSSKLGGLAGHGANTGHLLNPGSNGLGHEVPTASSGEEQGGRTPFVLGDQPRPDDLVDGRVPPNVLTQHLMAVMRDQRCCMNPACLLKHGLLYFHLTHDGPQSCGLECRLTSEADAGWR